MGTRHHIVRTAAAAIALLSMGACDQSMAGDPIGPRGGTVTSLDGRLTLSIPAGALDEEVYVSIEEVEEYGPGGAVGPTYELAPHGLAFSVPAMVRYDTDALPMEQLQMADVALVVEREGTWFYLSDQQARGRAVSATAVYLSSFSLISELAPPEQVPEGEAWPANDDDNGEDHDQD